MIDVSIVIPCLNEARSLDQCLANARMTLVGYRASFGLRGEIIVADNGSTDGSQAIAERAGARVVDAERRGYGAALSCGMAAANGRYLVMADADGSYNFLDSVPMVGRLIDGADLCMGSRFRGGIARGAMPWKNRYIGNPLLTGVLNLFFRAGIDDAHCGIRALTADAFARLKLGSDGMEFASEMVIKASLQRMRIDEVPATLSPDLRDRPPHLRPFRDGWRHLRYLFMLSPTWVFGVPALIGAVLSLLILAAALMEYLNPNAAPAVGNYWAIFAAAMLGVSHMAGLLAAAGNLYGLRAGYRLPDPFTARIARSLSLETMLVTGVVAILAGVVILAEVAWQWRARNFAATYSVVPAVFGTLLLTLGFQSFLGGFLLAIVGGNEAKFMSPPTIERVDQERQRLAA